MRKRAAISMGLGVLFVLLSSFGQTWGQGPDHRTQYFSLGSEAFVPGSSNVEYFNTYGCGGANIWPADTRGALVAPVNLPHGAVITNFKVFFYDTSLNDMYVRLYIQPLEDCPYVEIAQVDSSGISGYGSKQVSVDHTVDNRADSYLLYAFSESWDDNLKIKGVVITYTIKDLP